MANDLKVREVIVWGVVAVLAIDFIGFMVWALSGQTPPDGFFFGTITKHILTAIF